MTVPSCKQVKVDHTDKKNNYKMNLPNSRFLASQQSALHKLTRKKLKKCGNVTRHYLAGFREICYNIPVNTVLPIHSQSDFKRSSYIDLWYMHVCCMCMYKLHKDIKCNVRNHLNRMCHIIDTKNFLLVLQGYK